MGKHLPEVKTKSEFWIGFGTNQSTSTCRRDPTQQEVVGKACQNWCVRVLGLGYCCVCSSRQAIDVRRNQLPFCPLITACSTVSVLLQFDFWQKNPYLSCWWLWWNSTELVMLPLFHFHTIHLNAKEMEYKVQGAISDMSFVDWNQQQKWISNVSAGLISVPDMAEICRNGKLPLLFLVLWEFFGILNTGKWGTTE